MLLFGAFVSFLMPKLGAGKSAAAAVAIGVVFLGVGFFLFVYIWVRWTLPRFRYDTLMEFGWKYMVPVTLANVLITGFVIACAGGKWRSFAPHRHSVGAVMRAYSS